MPGAMRTRADLAALARDIEAGAQILCPKTRLILLHTCTPARSGSALVMLGKPGAGRTEDALP